jgi:hypothetical protein
MSSKWHLWNAVPAALVAAGAAFWFALRPWYNRWGATAAEARRTLPGDELIPAPHRLSQRTKAVTIDAPAEAVWPWLAQMGQGRGGLYSYEWLENLIGMEMRNADRIVPEWQRLQVGDLVRMGPEGKAPPPFVVAAIEPGRALVIGHRDPTGAAWRDTYAFVLERLDARTTRLIHRNRAQAVWVWDLLEPGYFVMERRMLLGIKERAEAAVPR